ncbi:MAG: hypothetical protein ACKV2Q_09305 [Planctomycetaceae bacterium]
MTTSESRQSEAEIRRLLESNWEQLSARTARRAAREVVWSRRWDRARTCVLAATVLLACQIGLDLACLAKLQALRQQAVSSVIQQSLPS